MAKDKNVFARLCTEKEEVSNAPVQISEICTRKNEGWIKLKNPNSEAVTLSGMYMSDDPATPDEWDMPLITIGGGEELIIVMKNNKTADALMKIQADFSLKEGETLVLADRDGNIISSVYIPWITEGKTYKLQPDGKYVVR